MTHRLPEWRWSSPSLYRGGGRCGTLPSQILATEFMQDLVHVFLNTQPTYCPACRDHAPDRSPVRPASLLDYGPDIYFVCRNCRQAYAFPAPSEWFAVRLGAESPHKKAVTALRFQECQGPSTRCACRFCHNERTHSAYTGGALAVRGSPCLRAAKSTAPWPPLSTNPQG